MSRRGTGRPKFLGNPGVPTPCSSTPAGPDAPGHYGAPARPPRCPRRRLAAANALGAQSHGLDTGCLRFVGCVAPPLHARLASGCRPGSTGWDWLPTGLLRKVLKVCSYIFASLPKLPWRKDSSCKSSAQPDLRNNSAHGPLPHPRRKDRHSRLFLTGPLKGGQFRIALLGPSATMGSP